jgi:hypothetical protein
VIYGSVMIVKRVMEYDKATTQSNFIDKNLIVAAENNRYTGKRSAISQNFEPEHKNKTQMILRVTERAECPRTDVICL